MKNLLLAVLISVSTIGSLAHASWVYGGKGKVVRLLPQNGWWEIKFDIDTVTNPLNCSVNDGRYAVVTQDNHAVKLIGIDEASTLLMSSVMGGSLQFHIYISNEECFGNRPVLRLITALAE